MVYLTRRILWLRSRKDKDYILPVLKRLLIGMAGLTPKPFGECGARFIAKQIMGNI